MQTSWQYPAKIKWTKTGTFWKKFDFKTSYRDYLNDMICSNSTADYFLGDCKNCPNIETVLEQLKAISQRYSVENITYNQWLTTDRYFFIIFNIKR